MRAAARRPRSASGLEAPQSPRQRGTLRSQRTARGGGSEDRYGHLSDLREPSRHGPLCTYSACFRHDGGQSSRSRKDRSAAPRSVAEMAMTHHISFHLACRAGVLPPTGSRAERRLRRVAALTDDRRSRHALPGPRLDQGKRCGVCPVRRDGRRGQQRGRARPSGEDRRARRRGPLGASVKPALRVPPSLRAGIWRAAS